MVARGITSPLLLRCADDDLADLEQLAVEANSRLDGVHDRFTIDTGARLEGSHIEAGTVVVVFAKMVANLHAGLFERVPDRLEMPVGLAGFLQRAIRARRQEFLTQPPQSGAY